VAVIFGWEGNRWSCVVLAMHHNFTSTYIHMLAQWPQKQR